MIGIFGWLAVLSPFCYLFLRASFEFAWLRRAVAHVFGNQVFTASYFSQVTPFWLFLAFGHLESFTLWLKSEMHLC